MRNFSLIVATRNRPENLKRLFATLREQTFKDFEVIVVDQSDSLLSPVVEEVVNSSGLNAIYLRDTGKGLSRARNIGLEKATGKIWAFPDDDCWYAPNLLEQVANIFKCDRDLVLLSGIYTEPGRWNPRFPRKWSYINLWNVFVCISSVTIFVRSDILGNIRFNEHIGVGTDLPSAEEIDFVIKILARGYKGVYDPSLIVYHEIERASNTIPEHVIKRERANAYVLMSNALRCRAFLLWLKLMGQVGKGLVRAFRTDWGRDVFKARWEGYRLALTENRNVR